MKIVIIFVCMVLALAAASPYQKPGGHNQQGYGHNGNLGQDGHGQQGYGHNGNLGQDGHGQQGYRPHVDQGGYKEHGY